MQERQATAVRGKKKAKGKDGEEDDGELNLPAVAAILLERKMRTPSPRGGRKEGGKAAGEHREEEQSIQPEGANACSEECGHPEPGPISVGQADGPRSRTRVEWPGARTVSEDAGQVERMDCCC